MPAPAALITQCLQHDFVAPVGRYDALPNRLHIGFEEARRLMGDHPDEGPVARVMRWAQQQPDAQLKLVHIRDWHDSADPAQQQHLAQFGEHCIQGTHGARFAFPESDSTRKAATIINSPGLNDFLGTPLADDLATSLQTRSRIGVMGVWTEARGRNRRVFRAGGERQPQRTFSCAGSIAPLARRADHRFRRRFCGFSRRQTG
jgi:nicotinamidase-related amidase